MKSFDVRSYSISDFIEWFETDKIDLSPDFQRRSVWNASAKSYFIDTIIRGKPFPKIILMNRFDRGRNIRVVVDGQQRLRTIKEFYDGAFHISKAHNKDFSGQFFCDFDDETKNNFLQYEISVDQLAEAPYSELLDIFARINRYTVKLNAQELRNAKYSGFFKVASFEVGYQYVDYFLKSGLFNKSQISRMQEAELCSDILAALVSKIQSNKSLDQIYEAWEDREDGIEEAKDIFHRCMANVIDAYPDGEMRGTCWTRAHMFYSLVLAIAHFFRPVSGINIASPSTNLLESPSKLRFTFDKISEDFFSAQDVLSPDNLSRSLLEFLRASTKATTDTSSREERSRYIVSQMMN